MRILISVDIEGISGIAHPDQTMAGANGYEDGRRLMTQEANAAIAGAFDGGATEVCVVDSHGQYRNLIFSDLHPRAELISGKPRLLGMMAGLAECGPWDGVFFVGYHARAGAFGVLAHTINGASFSRVEVNGEPVGETFLNAHLAWEYGVPVRLASGDDRLVMEAKEMLPNAELVMVKRALGNRVACHRPLALVHQELREAAARAVTRAAHVEARLDIPSMPAEFDVRITTLRPVHADCFAQVPGVERVDGMGIRFSVDKPSLLLQHLNCFAAMSASL